MNVKEASKYMETKYESLSKVAKCNIWKKLFIQANAVDKEANLVGARKMVLAFQLNRNLYNVKSNSAIAIMFNSSNSLDNNNNVQFQVQF